MAESTLFRIGEANMHLIRPIAVLACATAIAACRGTGQEAASPDGRAVPGISRAVIDSCAGMTREKAASLLGVDRTLLSDYSRTEGALRNCLFSVPERRSNTVAFTLSLESSADAAAASMTRAREDITAAQRSIDSVTGSRSTEAAVQTLAAGDDAFYSPVNGALTMRVRNVIATVTSPQDMERKMRVANAIAQGLRQ